MSDAPDPFSRLAGSDAPVDPRPEFAAAMRARLGRLLTTFDDPTDRSATMPDRHETHVTPYLTVHDGNAALAFYADAFGAEEVMRVVMDPASGSIGHAEFHIGDAVFYLSDEHPALGVVSPRTMGGTSVTLHLTVDDVDELYGRVVGAGGEPIAEPADQPHGARHGTLVDPFGHRWLLSQQIEAFDAATYARRVAPDGVSVRRGGGIWAAVLSDDAPSVIRFAVDVLGFEERLVVPGARPGQIDHSELVWPEGGVVQIASTGRGNPYSERPPGAASLYVVTADPIAVHGRCLAAGAEIIAEPSSPHYDPDGMVFGVRDVDGNLWSFGTYAGATA
ncbi:MAG: VOC family protein [Acidimicrobiales bacterium]|nr:VOC family protein [Acidimicrobiales bacterium]